MATLFWHRRDLRAVDNRGLATAAEAGPVVPAFCLDDGLLAYAGAGRVSVLLEALADLRSWYRDRGSDLLVVHGEPDEELPALAAEYDADRVVWNEDYSGYADRRDEAVEAALLDDGVETRWVTDHVLHEPGAIRTNDGDPYQVFTYFWKKWRDRENAAPAEFVAASDLAPVSGDPVSTLEDLGFERPSNESLEATRDAATERLAAFVDGPIYEYADARDVPAAEGTSRLSQDLKFGLLGVREVYAATESAMDSASDEDAAEGVREFQRQLAWREFYVQVLADNQATVTENYTEFTNPIEWRDDPEELAAWKRGETGYPIVDAGMRQLLAEGYVHNRVRMLVASFLTKDLLVDWRAGYDWFRERLHDHDTANDVGGWQWAASTGTDAQPYFRVFNPTTQGERYDPDAAYISTYVDELAGVDPETIHAWPDLDPAKRATIAPEYPAPIVDHAERREAAIAAFERARGDD
ncbi:MAG: deoxyribodipyrimidine photo-lyase [Halanaeroarchaeum sp.]